MDQPQPPNQSETQIKIQEPMPVVAQPEPEKELYTWEAPSRLYKKRNREFYSTVAALVILLSVILIFAKEFLLIAVIMALGFVAYALASVEPDLITHTITNKGIRTTNRFFSWGIMSRFWWDEKWNQKTLHLETPGQLPGQLVLLLGKGNGTEIESVVSKYLVKDKPAPTWIDKTSKWLQEKVPLEAS